MTVVDIVPSRCASVKVTPEISKQNYPKLEGIFVAAHSATDIDIFVAYWTKKSDNRQNYRKDAGESNEGQSIQ